MRPIRDADIPFLRAVYASTRAQEMALVDWNDDEKRAFLDMQFDAQHRYYREHYPRATFDVILRGDDPVGRLYVEEWPEEIRIIDIALLPESRDQGIGSGLLCGLMDRATRMGKGLSIHVEKSNPAMRLYGRLGFEKTGEHGLYDLMRWTSS